MLARVLAQLLSKNAAGGPAEGRARVAAGMERGRTLRREGRLADAVRELAAAYDGDPDHPGLLRELVTTLIEADDCAAAEVVAARAAQQRPGSREAVLLLGMARQKLHRCEEALVCYERALAIGDEDAELRDLRGSALQELGRLEEAFTEYDRAIALGPDLVLPRFHRGLARLLAGDFRRGWPDYELRLSGAGNAGAIYPRWDGASRSTVLVRREQGLGDEIMFASIFGDLQQAAERCVVECDRRLAALFARSFPAMRVVPSADDGSTDFGEGIDAEIPAGSLGPLFRAHPQSFPRHRGYLSADPERIAHWKDRLHALGPGLKVGISWRGGVRRTRSRLRSLGLEAWGPILGAPGVRFVSLQYTPGAENEIQASPSEAGRIAHWPEAIADYDDTAALVCALDLVISVCTSVVHLCGALNRPAWVLAPFSPEWRYGFTGEGMPWYPSVRMFRQRSFGNWQPVVSDVADALRAFAAGR